jgi:hypothetical protein
MLVTIQTGLARPVSYPVDPNAAFQPGMIGQLKKIGSDVVMGVSDGVSPFGLFDDIKDTSMTMPSIDEVVILRPAIVDYDGYSYTAGAETWQKLRYANIMESSFVSRTIGLSLDGDHGLLIAPVGTALNWTTPDSATPNAIRTIVSYSYFVANIPGEDTTLGSGRATIWFTRGVFATDQFEITPYPLNAPLYVSPSGKLTAQKTLPNQPSIAMVCSSPAANNNFLEFVWF